MKEIGIQKQFEGPSVTQTMAAIDSAAGVGAGGETALSKMFQHLGGADEQTARNHGGFNDTTLMGSGIDIAQVLAQNNVTSGGAPSFGGQKSGGSFELE